MNEINESAGNLRRYISHEEEAPSEKTEPLFSDPAAREYIASLLNTSHQEEFQKSITIKGAEFAIHQELSNLTGMISLWLGLYERVPNKQSERAQSLLKRIKDLQPRIAELTTAKYFLDQPNTLILLRNATIPPVPTDDLL